MMKSRSVVGIPDATVHWVAELPDHLRNGYRYSFVGEVEGDIALLHAPGIGRCRISHGSTVEFCAEPGAAARDVEHFVNKNAVLALVHQRGELPLHASSVVSPESGQAILFCGDSGAGKSTMASQFQQRSWIFLADDMTRITRNGNTPLAWPGGPTMRLLPDAWQKAQGLESQPPDLEPHDGKVVMHVEVANSPASVAAVILLGGKERQPRLERLSGSAAVAAVTANVPGPGKLKAFGQIKRQMSVLEALLTKSPVVRLHGRATASAEALAEFLLQSLPQLQATRQSRDNAG
jgi:hypothetical protein